MTEGPEPVEVARLVSAFTDLAWGPMDAGEAAQFLSVSDERFRQIAPSLPRFKPPGLSYRYKRSELAAWSEGGFDGNGAATPISVGSLPRTKRPNPGGKRSADRLV